MPGTRIRAFSGCSPNGSSKRSAPTIFKVTGVVLVLALGIPVALVLQLFARPEPEQPAPTARWSGFGSSPALAAALCLLAIAIAGAAGWIGYSKTQQQLQLEALDLSTGEKPASGHVVMTALVQADLASRYTYTTKVSGSARRYAYVPLTSSTWRRGEPIAYFLKTDASLVEGKTGPFRITTPSSRLVSNGLPGPILDLYRKHGIALVDPPVVLDLNTHAEADLYFWAAFLAGLPGLFCLAMSMGLTIRQRRGLDASVEPARPR
jgi:hypothetical protein